MNKDELILVNPEDIKAELCKRRLYLFVKEFWDIVVTNEYVDNWHIKYICDELEIIAKRVINNKCKQNDLIINIPPGTSKSTICSILFPVWLWANNRKLKIITASYSAQLSSEFSNKSRMVIECDKFKRWYPTRLRADANNKTNYQTFNGGARYATSTGGTITGLHGDIIILDDPQNPELANSDKERNNTNEWVSATISTRKTNKEITPIILIQQRLHRNDVTGYLLNKNKNYKHICLPAELNSNILPNHLVDFYKNGLLDNKRLHQTILNELRIDLGTKQYNTQILQQPDDDKNSIIKYNWLTYFTQQQLIEMLGKVVVNFYIDTAYTADENNDPSAIIACFKYNECLYVLNCANVWLEFNELITYITQFTSENYISNRSKIYVEPKAAGKSIVQYLKKQTQLNVVETESPTKNKIERLNAISPKIESKRLLILEDKCNELVDQLCNNHPIHDDIRDCVVMAIENELINKNKGKYNLISI